MSIHRSYFKKNNTLMSFSETNTSRSPYIELFFGNFENALIPNGFSRFIFDLDLDLLRSKFNDGLISTSCENNISHILKMKNTSSFDEELLNDTWSNGRRRATSFDLVLWRIPKISGDTGNSQEWDEGVGYDYYLGKGSNGGSQSSVKNAIQTDKSFSDRPTNWFKRQTIHEWSQEGIYDNTNSNPINGLNYNGLTIIGTQHFEFGNEDIEFDMSSEINGILNGTITGVTGWGISFVPDVENITGLTENYSVGFFSRHTQTFYEPFLETKYDDVISDDRNSFYEKRTNFLYLFSNKNGRPKNLDNLPSVSIVDGNGDTVSGFENLPSCQITEGVYKVSVAGLTGATLPCIFNDIWTNISIDGMDLNDIENQFVMYPLNQLYQLSNDDNQPELYGFNFSGIKQDEKILNTDIRKINVIVKKAYTTKEILSNVEVYYRVYVREGNTEVQVEDWTRLNRTMSGFYFIFDTRDKIPNEYFVDIKVFSDRDVNTYKKQLKFQIVNKK